MLPLRVPVDPLKSPDTVKEMFRFALCAPRVAPALASTRACGVGRDDGAGWGDGLEDWPGGGLEDWLGATDVGVLFAAVVVVTLPFTVVFVVTFVVFTLA
jgi:hypothetical protein